MRSKVTALLAGLLTVLSGCTLAQPETEIQYANRFAGVYVVFDKDSSGRDSVFYDNPHLIEAGTGLVNTEYGKLPLPGYRLPAEEKAGQYIFPGIEGRSLFLVHGERGGSPYTECVSDMGRCETSLEITDEGSRDQLSGTVYIGPPQDAGLDWDRYQSNGILTFYRVFQSPEGQIYLDGTGNSSSGAGSYQEEHTSSVSAADGETTSNTVAVKVEIQYAPRLERLTVSQFDGSNTLLCADDLALRDELPEVICQEETVWVLVEEQSAEGTVRTVYSAPEAGEEPISSHVVVLLDDCGWGRTAELRIRFFRDEGNDSVREKV